MEKSQFKKSFVGEKPINDEKRFNFVEIKRSYFSEANFQVIQSYCNNMGYNLKYKVNENELRTGNAIIKQKRYFDLIVEKNLNNGNKRHAFITYEKNHIYFVYKHLSECMTYFISSIGPIKEESKFFFEPKMFWE